jgi:hypothetical protein
MQIQCPSCQSTNVKRFSLVSAEGANQVSATALSFDSNRRVGYTYLSGQIQSKASSITSPPKSASIFESLLGGCVLGVFLGAVCIVANILLAAFAGWAFLPWKLWMTFGFLGGLALGISSACKAYRFNREILPTRQEGWNESFLCQVCGESFIPTQLADDTSPRSRKESLQTGRSERLLAEGLRYENRCDIAGAAKAYAAAIDAGSEEAAMDLDRVLFDADEATCRSLIDDGVAADCRLADILFEESDEEDADFPDKVKEIRRLYTRAAKRGEFEGAVGMARSYISLGEACGDIDEAKRWVKEALSLGASTRDTSAVDTSIRSRETLEQGGDPNANFYEAMEYQKQQDQAHDVQYLLTSRKNSRNTMELYRKFFMEHIDKYDAVTKRELRRLDTEVMSKDAANDWTGIETQGLTSKAATKYAEQMNMQIRRVSDAAAGCFPGAVLRAFGPNAKVETVDLN